MKKRNSAHRLSVPLRQQGKEPAMISPTVSSVSGSSTTDQGSGSTGSISSLAKTDFLKLLTTQLQHQNPLNPMSDTDFTTQLAQFSTLEGLDKMNTTLV